MLRVIRQNSGYTQRRVAKLLGHKTPATLWDWENEKTMPSATSLIKLCILYNKTPRELYPDYYDHIAQQLHDSALL
jgi:transcriptional regulator with XRE-family HTH domain